MNRERMRRMLCHMIVDWDNIQLDVRVPLLSTHKMLTYQ